jgi:hypothetical protein|tara:strand:- start:520 stop:771 length:252 start_codon:yes stop_codon:yes gene_type:complete
LGVQVPLSAPDLIMKEIILKFNDDFYTRLNDARKLESPSIRNTKFCKKLVEAMVGAIEDDYKNKGEKNEKQTNPKTKKAKSKS